MKTSLLFALVALLVHVSLAERPASGPGATGATEKPKTTRSQATQCDDHAKYAARKIYGSDQQILRVSACRPDKRAQRYTVSFSMPGKQCSQVIVKTDANGVPIGDLAAPASCNVVRSNA